MPRTPMVVIASPYTTSPTTDAITGSMEAIMDAFENDGDPDWQLAYEAMSRIALTLEDIDFNVEKLDLDEQLAQKSKNKRQ